MDEQPFEIGFSEKAAAKYLDENSLYNYKFDPALGIPQTGDIVLIDIDGKRLMFQVLTRFYDLTESPSLTLLVGELGEIYSPH